MGLKASESRSAQLGKIRRLLDSAGRGTLKRSRYVLGAVLGVVLYAGLGFVGLHGLYWFLPMVAVGLAIPYWMNNFSHLPKTWTEKIDAELNQYDPIEKDAYRHLQNEIKSQNRPLYDCFEAWLNKERSAVLESQPRPVPSLKFLQKQV